MNYYISVLKKYASIKGRARRAEFWWFVMINAILDGGLQIVNLILLIVVGANIFPILILYRLLIFIPSIAVSIRRMHDVNKSGWFILIPIYGFILNFINGTKGDNKYGQDPKEMKESQITTEV